MFPLRDSHPTRKFPIITWTLIFINSLVFLLELFVANKEVFINQFALVPTLVDFGSFSTLTPFITSQFLHAGFIHIIGNMWFLKVFGDNVEERLGSFSFLLFYLLAGTVGGFLQYLFSTTASIPILGASGAVAGVLGAYLVFFPKHTVSTLVPVFVFFTVIEIPASIMLIYWFFIQLFSGVGSFAIAQVGGVAWWAHVGGFATGWLIARLVRSSSRN